MYDCTLSDHGRSSCLGNQPNSFQDVETLTRSTHPKLLTASKAPKKEKKKQKEEWNKLPEVYDDEEPKKVYNDPKCLQTAIASAMKSSLMHRLTLA
uniref:Uncharacterized protein n=1 Tax=Romanomermis culicivorax TaxID=13658 RepID=A0A915JM91_ROMCU